MLSATELREQTRINAHKTLYTNITHMANLGYFSRSSFLTKEHKLELEQLGYTIDTNGVSGPNIFNISWENPTNQNNCDMSAAKMYAKAYDVAYASLVAKINDTAKYGNYVLNNVSLSTNKLRDQLVSHGYSVSPYGVAFESVSISWT
jgi:hypothetical protein